MQTSDCRGLLDCRRLHRSTVCHIGPGPLCWDDLPAALEERQLLQLHATALTALLPTPLLHTIREREVPQANPALAFYRFQSIFQFPRFQ
eukprot:4798312-Prymnesium_polylepis.1